MMWTTIAAFLFAATSSGFDSCLLEASQSGYGHIAPFGGAWEVSVSPDGRGRLVVHDPDGDRVLSITVSKPRLEKLRAALSAADFMTLDDPALERVPDEDQRTVRVRCGEEVHDVRFGDTPSDGARETMDRVKRFSRALHVWVAVRSLFDDEKAVDTRPQDRRFLKEHPLP
jgi:hypothetical protein